MKDPFLELYADVQELWNDKKGLDWGAKRHRKTTIKKLEKFVDSFEKRRTDMLKEISFLKDIYDIN